MSKRKQEMQFRYYEMPEDSLVFTLTGESWIRSYGEGVEQLHFHIYAEIGICHDGRGEMVYEKKSWDFEPGCFTFIPPNYPHTTNSVPGTTGFWEYLFVDCEGLVQLMFPGKKASAERMLEKLYKRAVFFAPGENPGLHEHIISVFNEQREKRDYFRQSTNSHLILAITELIRLNNENLHEEPGEENADSDRLRPALQYISEHFHEELYISRLAELCALSETHFRRLFNTCMHLSPLDYINSVRIHKACVQLRSSNKTVRSVAYECGFSSISTFQRNFRKFIGMSTNEWRDKPENYEYKLNQYKINAYEGW